MPAPHSGTSGDPAAREALERLAAELDSRVLVTTLTTGEGRAPRLTVASRHGERAVDIYAGAGSYLWAWGEPIAAVTDPAAAADKASGVLRAVAAPQ